MDATATLCRLKEMEIWAVCNENLPFKTPSLLCNLQLFCKLASKGFYLVTKDGNKPKGQGQKKNKLCSQEFPKSPPSRINTLFKRKSYPLALRQGLIIAMQEGDSKVPDQELCPHHLLPTQKKKSLVLSSIPSS